MECEIKLFGMSANNKLARAVAEELHQPLSQIDIQRFADGEIYERVLESVRGDDVYIVAPIAEEVNDAFMEIMIVIDALRRASAGQINVVIPYLGYARQDRKAKSREPITAKMVASMLEMNGVDRVVAIDLHADQLQGFFDIPVDHLQAAPLLSDYFYSRNMTDDLVVVSPDHTGAGRARKFADLLHSPWGVVNDHVAMTTPESPDAIVGEVAGRRAIIVDDIVDTGRRVQMTARALRANGATDVFVVATHAVLSGDAAQRLAGDDNISRLVFTDTLTLPAEKQSAKFTTLSVAPLLAEAIQRIHDNRALDVLLKSRNNPEAKL
ncbi:ribose-phosphate diphosphokinase [Weissella confusa]|uniref:Ribose-phosphate pyrophosphokinase n=1 Tax=Weissella confusa TaxID=1583 RepID=A0A4Z0RXN1_WEICO|nr:ribose-phosphate diphosphokinase [Weissella confusa]TGE71908.1 ribose-phosphate pyrophosphokinase [Weissella confusa]